MRSARKCLHGARPILALVQCSNYTDDISMKFKQALDRWLERHQTTSNRLLHTLGIPATIVGVVLLFMHSWLPAVTCFVAGYLLQVIGHYLEGSRVGEVILLKKLFLPTGSFARRLTIISLSVAGLLATSLVAQVIVNRCVYFNLFETIAPGMYRSGQMPPEHLEQVIQRLGIKTVVNLCKVSIDDPLYNAERQVTQDNQAQFTHLPFLASLYPKAEQLNKLLDLIENIEPPFLIHCHGGADRTGTFFVLLALHQGQSWSQAMRQLSLLRFGYYSRTRSATITFPLYDFAEYAAKHDYPKDLENFRLWLKSDDGLQARQRWLDRDKTNLPN